MPKRLLVAVIILAACVSATVAGTTRVSAATPFTDISSSIFRNDIDWLYNAGITGGCTATRYCPRDVVTRAQMASFLARMFKLPTATKDWFSDDNGTLHEGNINRVAEAGITGGCASGKYCPDAKVSRAQMASFLARALALTQGVGNNYFYDDNGLSHESNIDEAAFAGIASGCGTWRFCPNSTVTREQMAAFLHRVVAPVAAPPHPAPPPPTATPKPSGCDPSYPTVCIPPPPPDLNCPDITYRDFNVVAPDPHHFDTDHDGIGCETQ